MEKSMIYTSGERRVDFTAVVKIPAGFVIVSPRKYKLDLTIDQSNLHETETIQTSPSYILTNINQKRTRGIRCFSRIKDIQLNGGLVYNLVIGEFRPVKLASGEPTTLFASDDTLAINLHLTYKCYEETLGERIQKPYSIGVIRHTEYVIDPYGDQIPYSRKCPYDFFEVLSEGCCTRYICVPYTLIFKPYGSRLEELDRPDKGSYRNV